MKKELRYLWLLLFASLSIYAQEITVSGTVKDPNGHALPGATILNKQSQMATQTDLDGRYSLKVHRDEVLSFSFLGMKTQEHRVTTTVLNIDLQEDIVELETVVVTALGITRNKKSLGYSTQEISGETVSATPVHNFADALHGEIAGLAIKNSGAMGGSSNMIIRGFSSLYGNNQALVVIDGTPIHDKTYNTADQTTGRGGYDYGNAATDINPNDIATLNVLKGAAATALYGSRGQNGVIMITTKKGNLSKKKDISVEFNSSLMVGTADKQTLPKYQKKYGAGYRPLKPDENPNPNNPYFSGEDINGDGIPDYVVQFGDDASYGAAYDPNLMVYQWNSFYPGLSTSGKTTPWVAAKNDPNSVWGSSHIYVNSLALSGATDKSVFRLGITNNTTEGNLANSQLKRNTINLSATHQISDKITASGNLTYTNSIGKGRVGTGYNGLNPMQGFRQWWQTNVDLEEQRQAYYATLNSNATWNIRSYDDTRPLYTDNFYFVRYQNYQNDNRHRYMGNISIDYRLAPWLNLTGKYSFDNYDEIRESRLAKGTAGDELGEYQLFTQTVSENNYDLIATIKTDLTSDISLDANVGWNLRVEKADRFHGITNGGLLIPGIYSLPNSLNALSANNMTQYRGTKKVDGLYARASFGYRNLAYLDGSIRTDRSSALSSESQNRYWYPSVSGSFIFSELLNSPLINFGKFRVNYAQVGNDTDIFNLHNTYLLNAPFGSSGAAENPARFLNPDLKPEMMNEYELGIEMAAWKNRLSFEVSYYNRKTKDLITPVDVSSASGASSIWLNAGDMVNKGIEANLNISPIRTTDFNWKVGFNFAKNTNEVLDLYNVDYLQLANVQGGISIGAKKGEPYGVIRGTGYVYNDKGDRVIGKTGQYLHSASTTIIGNMNPEWTGGIKNSFSYKNLNLSFLIDAQKGGSVFSLDTYYGFATGLYDNAGAGINDLGNPVRNPLEQGGGVILPGVKENGTPNDIRVRANRGDGSGNPWGYLAQTAPRQAHVYDASYVKLRNVTLSYDFPERFIKRSFIEKCTLSVIGRNLWIIHKNIPYSDPEAGLSAGNIQGYQSGAHPTIREIGASLKVQF
ncbi:SusC/RagA family TonB-linked outer membrane protein [Flavobacterium sp. JP2137]|uniref:SusC/RagA family TonB-linked outer membrane protein n=1 Tax=Flavobacterium sp. JP2137 TaxID=3414510 RepID=UPI003D2FE899